MKPEVVVNYVYRLHSIPEETVSTTKQKNETVKDYNRELCVVVHSRDDGAGWGKVEGVMVKR